MNHDSKIKRNATKKKSHRTVSASYIHTISNHTQKNKKTQTQTKMRTQKTKNQILTSTGTISSSEEGEGEGGVLLSLHRAGRYPSTPYTGSSSGIATPAISARKAARSMGFLPNSLRQRGEPCIGIHISISFLSFFGEKKGKGGHLQPDKHPRTGTCPRWRASSAPSPRAARSRRRRRL